MRAHLTTDETNNLSRICLNCGKEFRTQRYCIVRALQRGGSPPSFCSRDCFKAGRSLVKDTTFKPVPIAERFWKYVRKTERCWIWTGSTFKATGYARTFINRQGKHAHRVSYEMAYGPIPDGLMVLHDCDRFYAPGDISYRLCVRPDHLFLGTAADNMADCKQKGRHAVGLRNGAYTKPESRQRGENSGMSKLTDSQVVEIRRRYKAGGISQEKLGKEYGVTQPLVKEIVHGRIWKHLPI